MDIHTLTPAKDPMGAAIADYYQKGKASRLRVCSNLFDEDEIPVSLLFREEAEMPKLERIALAKAQGRILDVGAGSGCHTLALQQRGLEVEAIDISPLSVDVMQQRGVRKARLANLFDSHWYDRYDTILMLMNGSGIVGKIAHLPTFFQRLKQLLTPDGCVWMDSSDIRYVFENEDGSMDIDLAANYCGEVDYQMIYRNVTGDAFDWLYIDFETLSYYASAHGFIAEKTADGDHYDYLACLRQETGTR